MPNRLATSPREFHMVGASIAAPIRMSFNVGNHDVTCLCAIAGFPKRVIVEELPPHEGRTRLQFQAFTEGSIGAVLGWLGARVDPDRGASPGPHTRAAGARY